MKRPLSKKLPNEKRQRQQLNTLAKAPKRITQRELENSLVGRMISTRRVRRIVASVSIGSLVALMGVVAVASFSPLLAVKEIIVSGTERINAEQISNALKSHIGTPLPLLREQEVAESLADFDLIESFSATAVPPNGLSIRISERQPICIITSGGARWLYDPAGVRIGKSSGDDMLPEIVISENPLNSQRFRNSIEVLMALPEDLLDQVEFIEARSKDDVQMSLRSVTNQRIIWGDSSDSVLKSKVLQALMKNHEKDSSVTFDVSSPNAPVVRFDNF
ncbi:MAG: FtsQ-type POTRA domain-containing protein [Rhodoluna sp.]